MTNQSAFIVRIASWDNDAAALMRIRKEVFVQEQKVPIELESDEYDSSSCYILAESYDNQPIACARLQPNGKVTRIAVLKPWRRLGVARAMLQQILDLAHKQERSTLYLHAQLSAITLYEEFGFTQAGKQFEEAGIEHIKMTWQAPPSQR